MVDRRAEVARQTAIVVPHFLDAVFLRPHQNRSGVVAGGEEQLIVHHNRRRGVDRGIHARAPRLLNRTAPVAGSRDTIPWRVKKMTCRTPSMVAATGEE